MKKIIQQVLVLFICICLLLVSGVNTKAHEAKYPDLTIEDSFVDDELMLALNNEESILMKNYTYSDFSNVGCIEVEDLTSGYNDQIINIMKTGVNNDINFKIEQFNRILKLKLDKHDKQNVLDKMIELSSKNEIEYISPNIIATIKADNVSNVDEDYNYNWAIEKIGIDELTNITGNSNVKIGIIDSGIDANHPELIDQIDPILSKSFTSNESNALVDSFGHGTAVAGVMASLGLSSDIASGICKDCTFVSLKVYETISSYKDIDISNLIEAINYAKLHTIDILNISFQVDEASNQLQLLKYAINNYSGLIICSAGNEYYDIDDISHYPGSFNCDNIIVVGASGTLDNLWNSSPGEQYNYQSNYGKNNVDLFAPGEKILVLDSQNNGYYENGGTSFAAPYVAGTVALMKSVYPYLSNSKIKEIILESVDYCANFNNMCVSNGRLNAYNAIENYKLLVENQITNIYDNINLNKGNFGYYNTTPGFVRIVLNANDSDQFLLDEGNIIVKDSNNNLLDIVINSFDDNYILVHLPAEGYYYIDLNIDMSSITDLNIKISRYEMCDTIDFFEDGIFNTSNYTIFQNNGVYADIKKINIKQASKYTVYSEFEENTSDSVQVFIYKIIVEDDYEILETVYNSNFDQSTNFTFNFEDGLYYIGFSGIVGGHISIDMTRQVNTNYENQIIPDPNENMLCGSQINLFDGPNSKSYGEANITVGFTRLLYFTSDFPAQSRLDYYWYSSDETVATVSEFGTVLAISNNSPSFTIVAVYKYDSSIIFTKTFNVIPGGHVSQLRIELDDITARKGDQCYIEFGDSVVPSDWIQHYIWSCENENITISQWGTITVGNNTLYGTYEIVGTNRYNENIQLVINIDIID